MSQTNKRSTRRQIKDILKWRLRGYHWHHHITLAAVIREIAAAKVEHIFLAANGTCVEVTFDMVASMALEMGYGVRDTAPFEVVIPRRGWLFLVPRHSASSRRRKQKPLLVDQALMPPKSKAMAK